MLRIHLQGERKVQLLLRAMADQVLSERDRLLQYTCGEFYQELSLFLDEQAARQKELEKLKLRSR